MHWKSIFIQISGLYEKVDLICEVSSWDSLQLRRFGYGREQPRVGGYVHRHRGGYPWAGAGHLERHLYYRYTP